MSLNNLLIREEQPKDCALIYRLTEIAFKPMPYSDGTESDVIDKLRASGELTLSLVAEISAEVVGHVAFSPVEIGQFKSGWYGLGPVAVHPDEQRKGIGTSLIKHGLKMLRSMDANGCALIGDPNYYSRFGFLSDGRVHYENLSDELVQWISFSKIQPSGELLFRPAFNS